MKPTVTVCSFLAVIPAKPEVGALTSGNPGFFVIKDNGFPITTSGMTINGFYLELLCKGIYVALH